ncbi:MAG: hypothetical protein ACJ71Z_03255 [Aeromicrobium sp.]
MTIGAGITLIVLGLILLLGVVQVDIPFINEYALGVLLTLAGIAGIILVLTVGRGRAWGWNSTYVERRPTTRVVERRIVEDDGPV